MVDLIGKKYYFFALSILLIVCGIIGYIIHGGFNLDIQFKGGTIINMKMNDGNFDTAKAEELVKNTIQKTAYVQKSQTLNTKDTSKKYDLMVINIASSADALSTTDIKKVEDAIIKEYKLDANTAVINEQTVQPFIGKELLGNGLKAVIWASILMIIYIAWRFRVMSGWSAGVMAVLALLHDALIMLSVYTILNIPLNESFIAAVLTILGYSMNDTIIIYDRIRENSNMLRKVPIAELVNRSILQTLNRSINTVVTVLICIVTTYIFARYYNITSMEEFTLPLIVGITSGCYSSIFIASPLWVMWKESREKKKISGKIAKA